MRRIPEKHSPLDLRRRNSTTFPQLHDLTGPDDARRTVNYWADEDATSFKASRHITRAEFAAVIESAHKRGLKVTGHLCAVGFREAAALGIDGLEHGLLVDTEFMPRETTARWPFLQ